jgi:hypothetical protein
MTENHLAELASILAAGLLRLRARKSSRLSTAAGESSLHNSPGRSGHAAVLELADADE